MKKFVLILCMLLANTSFADMTTAKSEALKVALNFSSSVHCHGVPYDENRPLNSVFYIDEYQFAVLQYVDLNCSGGSGTGAYILTPVMYTGGTRYAINTLDYPSGDVFEPFNLNTKDMENVVYNASKKHLSFNHWEYDEKDGNCCPSLKYNTTIDLKNNIIINRRFLGKTYER